MTSLRWIDAWHDALYGPAGFYTRDEGPAGHFATSAQGIPGVDEILAQAVVAVAEDEGCEVIVDFACGRGELSNVMAQVVGDAIGLIGVDVVARPTTLHPDVEWVRSPGGPAVPSLAILAGRRALVVAHEWLDVVPCTIAEVDDDGVLREVLVGSDGAETLGAPTSTQLRSAAAPRPGERVEDPQPRDRAWQALVEEVARHGAPGSVVLGIDYAHDAASMPPLGTLAGFRDGSECPPVPDGTCDITSHVVLDRLDVTDPPRTQRDVLLDLFGAEQLDPVPIGLARTDPPHYLARLAARSALTTATARGGLGDFVWFTRRV